ncbi:MAG: 1-acyl-sn-glycerol-3-phosphate acyltransferase [Tabrizicola sp.]|uniref:lysophospholipid acyltransferase family protein n=1 Tax=Tabrizicola sp. TaxID=2005166 RepID=UPI0027366E51|nr:1-acyl-sn-glycerol-3-phosphate acyltransferase [Tabrizicola sp.]MDP3262203.1 1-acyl-sn-glycerol-3-phosphate acyltransferase [Tabrizicola sp.]MDP3648051.1 1-acyl-sn-glycerol-3-phosphate acyltransferase [Paracoccaceae bacterium]MDZ4069665.1 1-acyl-sn-glycerol-3-phosphate acyltransferase [Tabrizicola sp.]
MIAFRWLLSLIFIAQMYVAMAVIALIFAPWALFSRIGARTACKTFCRWVIFTLRLLCGLRCEVRGTPPTAEAVVAAKHQSFLDIILIFNAVPAGKFIMKRELIYTPFLGQYALKIGCVPVNRGKRGTAIAKMKADVARGAAEPGQLIIYPQGTRVAPGVVKPYKVGTGLLYEQLAQPCQPVATNVGVFWPKRGILRHPGLAVVEFLPPIPPGKPIPVFMAELEAAVETHSDRLMAEAGFRPR